MKKKKIETVKWFDLKVGDFTEDRQNSLFCFSVTHGIPSCMGRQRPHVLKYSVLNSDEVPDYKRIKPTKSFIKLCKRLLKFNLDKGYVDNLSYVEALAALKKYG